MDIPLLCANATIVYHECMYHECKRKTHPPHIDTAILAQTFIVKAINLRDLSTFVIAADQRNPIGIANLESQEEEEGFDRVVAPIDKVTQEQVVLVGTLAADFEQFD